MNAAAEAMAEVLTRNDGVKVTDATPSDLAQRLIQLATRERAVVTRVRRSLAARR